MTNRANSFLPAGQLPINTDPVVTEDTVLTVRGNQLVQTPVDEIGSGANALTLVEEDMTIWVKTDGDDTTGDGTEFNAFLRPQRALEYASGLDFNGYTVTILITLTAGFGDNTQGVFNNTSSKAGRLEILGDNVYWQSASLIGSPDEVGMVFNSPNIKVRLTNCRISTFYKAIIKALNTDVELVSCSFRTTNSMVGESASILLAEGPSAILRITDDYTLRSDEFYNFVKASDGAKVFIDATPSVFRQNGVSVSYIFAYAYLIAEKGSFISCKHGSSASGGESSPRHFGAIATEGSVIYTDGNGLPNTASRNVYTADETSRIAGIFNGGTLTKTGYLPMEYFGGQLTVYVSPTGTTDATGLSAFTPISLEELSDRLYYSVGAKSTLYPPEIAVICSPGVYSPNGVEFFLSSLGDGTTVTFVGDFGGTTCQFDFEDTDCIYLNGGNYVFNGIYFTGGGTYGSAIYAYYYKTARTSIEFAGCVFEDCIGGVVYADGKCDITLNFLNEIKGVAGGFNYIFKLSEDCSVRVVSGLNTITGDIITPSGLFSVTRSFATAGVSAIANDFDYSGVTSWIGPDILAEWHTNYSGAAIESLPGSGATGRQFLTDLTYAKIEQAVTDNGQNLRFEAIELLVAIGSGATTNSGLFIPADAVVMGLSARTVTPDTTAVTYDIGDGTIADKWATAFSNTVDSTTPGTKAGPSHYATSTEVIITPSALPTGDGELRLTLHYYVITPPSS